MNWKKTVNIKDILAKDDDTDAGAVKVAKELATYLKRELHSYCTGCSDLEFIIQEFEAAKTQCQVNNALGSLYDWADRAKVWLG